jgi:hypothetical protein
MHRLLLALSAIVIAGHCSAPCFAQTTVPSALNDLQPTDVSADTDTDPNPPKAAAKKLWAAVASEDATAVRDLLLANSDQERELADALADILVAGQSLAAASREKIGNGSKPIAGQMVDPRDPQTIDQAAVTMTGDDVARIAVDGSIRPMMFRRTTDGDWKLDITDYLESRKDAPAIGAAEDVLPRQSRLLKKTAAVLHDSADKIRAGTFTTVKECDEAIQRGLHEVMIEAQQPTTMPATHASQ